MQAQRQQQFAMGAAAHQQGFQMMQQQGQQIPSHAPGGGVAPQMFPGQPGGMFVSHLWYSFWLPMVWKCVVIQTNLQDFVLRESRFEHGMKIINYRLNKVESVVRDHLAKKSTTQSIGRIEYMYVTSKYLGGILKVNIFLVLFF